MSNLGAPWPTELTRKIDHHTEGEERLCVFGFATIHHEVPLLGTDEFELLKFPLRGIDSNVNFDPQSVFSFLEINLTAYFYYK